MNCYYYLKNLMFELQDVFLRAKLIDVYTRRRGVAEIILQKTDAVNRLITDVRSPYIAFFIDRPEKTVQANTYHLFEDIHGITITKLELAHHDRQVTLKLEDHSSLHFLLYPPRANVIYEKDGLIREAFKRSDKLQGRKMPQPVPASPGDPNAGNGSVRGRILSLNPLLPRDHLDELIEYNKLDACSVTELREFTGNLVRALGENPQPRWLETRSFTTIPHRLLPVKTLKSFDSVNEGIRYAYYQIVFRERFIQEKEKLEEAVQRERRKHQNRIEELRQSHKSDARAEHYERLGHLLMANNHQPLDPALSEVTLPDLYNDNRPVHIPLRPGKGWIENAGYYYDKARKSRRSAAEAGNRRERMTKELALLKTLAQELRGIRHARELEHWRRERRDDLVRLGLSAREGRQQRTPFRRIREGGFEFWIGKNASGNDEMTARAHKEDIWLHARGYPGSHVVIRMNRSRENPPREILLKAASYAAYFSQGRGSALVPVSYVRRKFVRKPKGAGPGQVVLDREEVVMAAPVQPDYNGEK